MKLRSAHVWLKFPVNWLLLACAAFPFLWLNAFALLVLRARLVLGRWPSYNNPDPKLLGMDWHYNGVLVGFALVMTFAFVGIVGAVMGRIFSRQVPWTLVLLNIVTPVLTIALVRLEPWGFGDWLID